MRRRLVLLVALGRVLLVAPGCGPSPAVTIAPVGESPAGSLTSGAASVPIGIVLGFAVKADASAVVTAAVDDEALATVAPTTQSTEFVMVGLATGQTTLHVFVNGQEAAQLSVQVTPAAP
jgi:hypothetical protein